MIKANKVISQKDKNIDKNAKTKSIIGLGLIMATIAAGFMLVVANSALWVNQTLFNVDTFSTIAERALLSESSRDALASEVVDTALSNHPLAKNIIGDTTTKLISGLLSSNRAEVSVKRVISRLHLAITSENPKNIEYDLTGIKSVVDKIITLIGEEGSTGAVSQLPDKIVILDVSNLPKLYMYGTVFLWLAPIALIGAVILLARPHVIRRQLDVRILIFQGFAVIGTSVMALLVGPLFRPTLLAQVPSTDLRVVVDNIYGAFISNFDAQTMWLFNLGLIILGFAVCVLIYTNFISKWLKSKKA